MQHEYWNFNDNKCAIRKKYTYITAPMSKNRHTSRGVPNLGHRDRQQNVGHFLK